LVPRVALALLLNLLLILVTAFLGMWSPGKSEGTF